MSSAEQLWTRLASMPARSGVAIAWEDRFGDSLPALRPFLRVLPELALTYPCDEHHEGCSRRVVHHGPRDIVAVCGAQDGYCGSLALARSQLAIQEFDLLKLGAHISAALGLAGTAAASPELSNAVDLGSYAPFAGESFPAFLVIESDPDVLTATVERLAHRCADRFILALPTREQLSSYARTLVQQAKVIVLPLTELLVIDDATGQLKIIESASAALLPLRASAVAAAQPTRGFLTPPGTRWNAFQIGCVDGETISIKLHGETKRLTHTEMGMADSRSKKPNLQWALLQSILELHGALPRARTEPVKKQRRKLSRHLQAYFSMPDEPLESDGRGSWRARFRVVAP